MARVLETLLKNVIDYAGPFPPASLSVEEAFHRYRCYRSGPQASLLGAFVCPAAKLDELARQILLTHDCPAVISVIGTPAHDKEAWVQGREADAMAMNAFHEQVGNCGRIEVYEVAVPLDMPVEDAIHDLYGFRSATIFLECSPKEPSFHSNFVLAEIDDILPKLRLGGASDDLVPTLARVAAFLWECVSMELPFKVTGGVHHLFPGSEEHRVGQRYGMLGILGATALALAEDLSPNEIASVLEAPSGDWSFDTDACRCRRFSAHLEDCEDARSHLVSIGSCSVEEPYEEFVALSKASNR